MHAHPFSSCHCKCLISADHSARALARAAKGWRTQRTLVCPTLLMPAAPCFSDSRNLNPRAWFLFQLQYMTQGFAHSFLSQSQKQQEVWGAAVARGKVPITSAECTLRQQFSVSASCDCASLPAGQVVKQTAQGAECTSWGWWSSASLKLVHAGE